MNFSRDISTLAASSRTNTTVSLNPSLECDGVNVSSTHAFVPGNGMSYDAAVRFPLVDIINFWPNRTSGSYLEPGWAEDVHVEVVCLRPDQVAEGSRVPPTGREILDAENARFPTASSAVTLKYGVFGWMSAAVTSIMLVL